MTYKELISIYNDQNVNRFISFFLDKSIIEIKTILKDKDVNPKILEILDTNLDLIKSGYPVEYLLNKCYFYKNWLYIKEGVLIPRDETEELVELVLKENKNKQLKIVDMCSGSGCIGLSLKKECNIFDIICVDISDVCIDTINKNKQILNVDVEVVKSDLFDNLNKSFDILVCNPPYIDEKDENVSIFTRLFEPPLALFAHKNGLDFYIKIFEYLNLHTFKKAYFEIGFNQKEPLINILKKYNFDYYFYKDINNKDRILKIINK